MSHRFIPAVVVMVCALFGGCGGCGGDTDVADGGRDAAEDGGSDAGVLVTPPEIPWLGEGVPPIMLTPCPDGWREVHGGPATECDPYPEGGAESCDAGEAHFPGEPGCRPIGEVCPAGDYAASVPTSGPVLYVEAGAVSGGDGTLGAPFGGLSEVPWASLSPGVTVALAKGTYVGTLPLKAGVSVVGACVRETIVTGVAAPVLAVVSVTGAGESAVVRNITLRGAPQRGAEAERGRRLSLEGVLIDRVVGAGVFVRGAGTEVSLTNVVIRATAASSSSSAEAGLGIHVQESARLDATRLLVVGNRDVGVSVRGAASVVTLVDAVVRDTQPRDDDGTVGRGINVTGGGRLDATRLLVADNHDVGALVTDTGSVMTMTHAIVRGTKPVPRTGASGRGLSAERGGEFAGTSVLLANNREAGVFVVDAGTRAVLTDVVIRGTGPTMVGAPSARGLGAQAGAQCEATRLLVFGNTGTGLFIENVGTAVSVVDAAILTTHVDPDTGDLGRAASVQGGARFEAARLIIADNHEVGLLASDEGTSVNLTDAVIRDTRPRPAVGRFGRALQGQLGAHIEGTRVELLRGFEAGVLAASGATIALADALIHDLALSDCASSTCADSSYGYAAWAHGGSLSLTRFRVVDAAVCGVMVVPIGGRSDAALDLASGLVSGARIGACVQVEGYDVSRLTDDVQYIDNVTNLDSTSLPVPELPDL